MNKINLKPCPFCGNEAELKNYNQPSYYYYVRCMTCNAGTEGTVYRVGYSKDKRESKKIAVDYWNTRAQTLDDCPAPVQKLKNERGAGRKPKISKKTRDSIIYAAQSSPYRSVAKYFGVSVGTVHKIISEHKKTG